MENFSYSSYPDSGDSSPRSRDIDENQSWEEPPQSHQQQQQPQLSANYKVRFMCSYGGKIQPRPHDNQLSYIGGDTKILAVDRNIKFNVIMNKLAAVCGDTDICFKYQLPGEDLDALISVTNDEDLEHMMHEYDRLFRISAKPARLRLFLFRLNNNSGSGGGLRGNNESKSERQWFVEALNSVQASNLDGSSPPASAAVGNPDFLFGLDKGFPVVPVAKLSETLPTATPVTSTVPEVVGKDSGFEDQLLSQQIHQDMQRMQINKAEEANVRGMEKGSEKFTQSTAPIAIPVQLPISGYMQENPMVPSGLPVSGVGHEQQPIYFIPMAAATASVYQAPPSLRPVTGQVGQGYYPVQRVVPDVYREQQLQYNPMPPPPTTVQQQLPPKAAVYSEGIGISITQQPKEQPGYVQVGYDGAGRQVYYTTPYQAVTGMPVAAADGMQGGSPLSQEAKLVGGNVTAKPPQTSS